MIWYSLCANGNLIETAHAFHFQQFKCVAVSKLSYTNLIFIESLAKINKHYY